MTAPIDALPGEALPAGSLSPGQINGLAGAYVRLLKELGGTTWDFTQAVARADQLLTLEIMTAAHRRQAEAMGLTGPIPAGE
jgi:hypothetical protein